eukprot:1160066-Pelagomonas_calceolata.AAC.16
MGGMCACDSELQFACIEAGHVALRWVGRASDSKGTRVLQLVGVEAGEGTVTVGSMLACSLCINLPPYLHAASASTCHPTCMQPKSKCHPTCMQPKSKCRCCFTNCWCRGRSGHRHNGGSLRAF